MRYFLLLILLFTFLSCGDKPASIAATPFDYLVGDWERTNEKEGRNTFEHWQQISSNELEGHGYSLEKRDTVFNEHLRLFKIDQSWILSVRGPNENPTDFEVTQTAPYSFTAENKANEFPKKIVYSYFDDVLSARVSNDSLVIPFIFWRIEE